ncbi:tetratricopeptide repeat protein [Gemmatimonas groenlandica]|uniref:Tetratricopeptide repeat protein n=1 Tax=Gemmatimonas groenlandica TaxID=2732249 RepID=A0A6M4INT1_9BACT|nr:tetratricopeptide repeat protein [Gemmatimonas groenlandica]QJR35685.1 tetratricopeptide repeat protein [Gemmatimonas groenlandica]
MLWPFWQHTRSLHALTYVVVIATALNAGASRQPTPQDSLASIEARRDFLRLEAVARERVGRDPRDDVAWWYLARTTADDPQKRDALIPRVQQCTRDLPRSPRCHHALGLLYAAIVTSDGLTSGLRYASRIKESFTKALVLEPSNFEMRRDLVQFYLQAPRLVGGSTDQAVALAEELRAVSSARGAILRADIHAYAKEWEQALDELNRVVTDGDADLARLLAQAHYALGTAMIRAHELRRAQVLFERVSARSPNDASFQLGLGRVMLERGALPQAIIALEKAVALDAMGGAHYRLGLAYAALGRSDKAIVALEQFLVYRPSGDHATHARAMLVELRRGAR